MFDVAEDLAWARTLKDAASKKGLAPVSDIEYLQHAIESRGETDKALKKLECKQKDRTQYCIHAADKVGALALINECSPIFPIIFGSTASKSSLTSRFNLLSILDDPVKVCILFHLLICLNCTAISFLQTLTRTVKAECYGRDSKNFHADKNQRHDQNSKCGAEEIGGTKTKLCF